jgi:hypothetical protein
MLRGDTLMLTINKLSFQDASLQTPLCKQITPGFREQPALD